MSKMKNRNLSNILQNVSIIEDTYIVGSMNISHCNKERSMRNYFLIIFNFFLVFQSIHAFDITIRTVEAQDPHQRKITDYKIDNLNKETTISDLQKKFLTLDSLPHQFKQDQIDTQYRLSIGGSDYSLFSLRGKTILLINNNKNNTLNDYLITGGTILYASDLPGAYYVEYKLKYDPVKNIKIDIVGLKDQTDITKITIHNLKTVADLKEIIRNKKNMAIDIQRLVFGLSTLNNDNSLYSYGIKDGDTIILQKLVQTETLSTLRNSLTALKKSCLNLNQVISKFKT